MPHREHWQHHSLHLEPHGENVERSADGHPLTRPGLIATDLDGTIISYAHTHSGKVSQRTAQALQAARNAEIPVVFVTGRPMRWMYGLADSTGLGGPAICSNGAVILDLDTHQILEAHPMDLDTVVATHRALQNAIPGAMFSMETLDGFVVEPRFLDDVRRRRKSEASDQDGKPEKIEDPQAQRNRENAPNAPGQGFIMTDSIEEQFTPGTPVLKFMVKVTDMSPDELLAVSREAVGDIASVTHSAPNIALVEISRPDVNKALTLAEFTDSLGIAADAVVAFGDQLNDLEMIRWAGTGYAVASGHPELVEAADVVAEACDNDGVAKVIEHLLGLPE